MSSESTFQSDESKNSDSSGLNSPSSVDLKTVDTDSDNSDSISKEKSRENNKNEKEDDNPEDDNPNENEEEDKTVGRAETIAEKVSSNVEPDESKEEEEEEHDGVKKSEVKLWVKEGLLVHGPPPKNDPKRNFRSPVYSTGGIKFLYWEDSGDEMENWFACEHCEWINFVIVGKGTTGLSKHAKTHSKEVPLEIKKRALAELLASAIEFGYRNGIVGSARIEQQLPDTWTKFDASIFILDLKKFSKSGAGPSQQPGPQKSKQQLAIERARAITAHQNNSTKTGTYFLFPYI